MSPQTRRAEVAARSSSPSLSGLAARLAPSRRTRVRARRWLGRAMLAAPALAIVGADAVRRGPWLAHMARVDVVTYAASLAMSAALWGALAAMAARRRGVDRAVAGLLLFVGALLAIG